MYKNKKRDQSLTQSQVGALRANGEGEHVGSHPENNNNNNHNRNGELKPNTNKEDHHHNSSSTVIDAGSENSLDDSGTYLPPIL